MCHKIGNMFARIRDGRRIATRPDRCPILFLLACALAATVICRLHVLTLARSQSPRQPSPSARAALKPLGLARDPAPDTAG